MNLRLAAIRDRLVFLAAYAAVNSAVRSISAVSSFLAAYAAVNREKYLQLTMTDFLAAYAAVNVSKCWHG